MSGLITRRGLIKVAAPAIVSASIIRPSLAQVLQFSGHTPSGGGGSFSDSDWPSPLNRPIWNSATNVLTWVGPFGGGPNNGSPAQQSLTLLNSSSISTTGANQTISGKNLNVGNGQIQILHSGLTIKNCRIFTDGQQGVFGAGIFLNANVNGLIIEDCLWDGNGTSQEGFCPHDPFGLQASVKSIFRRNFLTGYENHITLSDSGGQNNLEITDNYFTRCANQPNSAFDGDMIEIDHMNTLLIQHNQFDGSNSQVSNQAFNSMINVANQAPISGVIINNNLFSNVNTVNSFILCQGPDFGGGAASFTWTNNGYYNPGRTSGLPNSLQSGLPNVYIRSPLASPYTIMANSGNYTSATATGTSGPLINGGSGQI